MKPFSLSWMHRAGWGALAVLVAMFSLAKADEPAKTPAPLPELFVVISQPITSQGDNINDYERFALAFPDLVAARKWPIKVKTERLGGGGPDHPLELRIFLMGLRQEVPSEFTLRAWLTLVVDGKKIDLGVVRTRYNQRFMQPLDRVLESLFNDLAKIAADKVEPLLFQRGHTSQQTTSSPSKNALTLRQPLNAATPSS